MGTYDHRRLLKEWSLGNLSQEAAMGHTLQHLGLLHTTQDEAAQQRRQQQQQIKSLQATAATLKQENEQLRRQLEQWKTYIDSLIGLSQTVYQLKDGVDSLNQRLGQDPT